jgi:murein DD-endopeptidase MepM/ murein hydrolase activator NlpD
VTVPTPARRTTRTRVAARIVTALTAAMLLATAAVAQEPGLEEQLSDTNAKLQDARDQQANLQREVGDAQTQLAAVDTRLQALESQLREREAELVAATEALEAARQRTEAISVELAAVTDRLEASRKTLEADRERFGNRVAAAYKYGGPVALTSALFQAEDFSDLVTTGYLVRSVLDEDKGLVDRVAEETRTIAAERRQVDLLRDQLATEQAIADRARLEVERATEVQRELTTLVAEERSRRADVLATLESNLATYKQLVSSDEAESARIAAELAKSRWRAGAPGAGELLWPTDGRAGSGFGYRTHPIFGSRRLHTGIDIGGPTGQPIIAAADGLVVSAGWRGGYGMAVVIDHGGGLATLYAHQSRLTVSEGTVVGAGQKIGEIGSTGQSTGPHLHFEVRVNGSPRDPMEWY